MTDKQNSPKRIRKNVKTLTVKLPKERMKISYLTDPARPQTPPPPPTHVMLTELGVKKRKSHTHRNTDQPSKRLRITIKEDETATPTLRKTGPRKTKHASGSSKVPIELDLDPLPGSTAKTAIDLSVSDDEVKGNSGNESPKGRPPLAEHPATAEDASDDDLFCKP